MCQYTHIRTDYVYPDGDVIDLFTDGSIVTDLGEAARWLWRQGGYAHQGALSVRIGSDESLTDAVTRLAEMVVVAVSNQNGRAS